MFCQFYRLKSNKWSIGVISGNSFFRYAPSSKSFAVYYGIRPSVINLHADADNIIILCHQAYTQSE